MASRGLLVSYGLCLLATQVISVDENSTLTTTSYESDIEELETARASGDGETESTTDDEDGLNTYDEDYYDYYIDEDEDDAAYFNYSWTELEETYDQPEWEGFDGIICPGGTRFGKRQICDGVPDCHDCSDEENCTGAASEIFMCYTKGKSASDQEYSISNPKCIDLNRFCDGLPDCANAADERYTGSGFRCPIKNRFRSCVLPQDMICDGVVHCEDESDVCPEEDENAMLKGAVIRLNLTDETESFLDTPDEFFRCLNTGALISLKQLCDGSFDCPDLSDECLCEVRRSPRVDRVCSSMCAEPIWREQAENRNCEFCGQGEIYWNAAEESTVSLNLTDKERRKTCFSAMEMMAVLENSPQETKEPSYEIIECFDLILSGSTVRARKCDGRPECFFGEDECGIDCRDGGREERTVGSGQMDGDPDFCRLFTADMTGYACSYWLNEDQTRRTNLSQFESIYFNRRISVCDGIVECEDGSDEAFCPTRIQCSAGTNDTKAQTFDVAQRCDGFSHCNNGKDEDAANCSLSTRFVLPCENPVDDVTDNNFRAKDFLDGRKQCSNSADECPPFFNTVPELREKVLEGKTREPQIGISSHSKAIDSMALQIFLIAAAFVGISALLVSLALGLYNVTIAWYRFWDSRVGERNVWVRNCMIYVREITVNLGITAAKVFVCAFFAMIRIKRSEETNYSLLDLKWRSGYDCSMAGAMMLVGTQVPVFALAFFGAAYLLFRNRCTRQTRKTAENGKDEVHGSLPYAKNEVIRSAKERRWLKVQLIFGCLVLTFLSWLPVLLLASMLSLPSGLRDRTQTYGWVRAAGSPTIFRANLLETETAASFASTLVAIRNRSFESPSNDYFTYPEFVNVVDSVAPSLGMRFHASYGYFAHSGTCLPAFLVHVNGGEAPFDIAVSNSWTWGLSVTILVIDFALIFFTSVLTSRYGAGLCKTCCSGSHFDPILNHTFSRLVLIEALTWLFICTLFFMKAAAPDSFTDYTYTVLCYVILGINCGGVTPFVLLARKFRLQKHPYFMGTKSRSQAHPDATRIIEVYEENEEQKPLTNGASVPSGINPANEEQRGLMEGDKHEETCEN